MKYIEAQGVIFLTEAATLIDQGKAEDVLRHALSAKLPLMFPEQPWWIKQHVIGTESHVKFFETGKSRHGFVDVLVGATVIEYERNLRTPSTFNHGLHQVKQYCAAQLNASSRPDLLIVLSDSPSARSGGSRARRLRMRPSSYSGPSPARKARTTFLDVM
jgi:hypothetical protein